MSSSDGSDIQFSNGFSLFLNNNKQKDNKQPLVVIPFAPGAEELLKNKKSNQEKEGGEDADAGELSDHQKYLQNMAKGDLHHRQKGILARAGNHTEAERMKIAIMEEERRKKMDQEEEQKKESEQKLANLEDKKALLEAERAKKAEKRKNKKNKKKKGKKANADGAGKAEGALSDDNSNDDDEGSE